MVLLATDCAEKKEQKSEDRRQKSEVNYLPQKGTKSTKKLAMKRQKSEVRSQNLV